MFGRKDLNLARRLKVTPVLGVKKAMLSVGDRVIVHDLPGGPTRTVPEMPRARVVGYTIIKPGSLVVEYEADGGLVVVKQHEVTACLPVLLLENPIEIPKQRNAA